MTVYVVEEKGLYVVCGGKVDGKKSWLLPDGTDVSDKVNNGNVGMAPLSLEYWKACRPT